MNVYIDESGSINNHSEYAKEFVICLVYIFDKKTVKRAFKRFVSKNIERLKELDDTIKVINGKPIDEKKMFKDGKFVELKGVKLDKEMKTKFIERFSKIDGLHIFYIHIDNTKLSDQICKDKTTVFNYSIKLAIEYFINNGFFPEEQCFLQIDERNVKTDKKYFLEQYLTTELLNKGVTEYPFKVQYFDSSQNAFIQVADVFANLYYSQLKTGVYTEEMKMLEDKGKLKFIFKFPLSRKTK